MWFVWFPIGLAVLAWFGYVWIKTLVTKYEHTIESIILLGVLLVTGVILGLNISYAVAPEWTLWPRIVLTASLGFGLFIVFSYVAVNLWCSLLASGFDEKIELLEEEAAKIEQRLAFLRLAEVSKNDRSYSPKVDYEKEAQDVVDIDSLEELRKFVESWQQAGGEARVRSIKVTEWREEVVRMSDQDLTDEEEALILEINSEVDEGKKDQAQARLAVLKIESLRRDMRRSTRREERQRIEGPTKIYPTSEMEYLHNRLREINAEIQQIEEEKQAFFEGIIKLSWRERP